MAIDFGDLASRYLNARIDSAMQPFSDPEAYMNRRLGVDQEANVKPRSTTITYNDDGTQTITQKQQVTPTDYSAGADYSLSAPQGVGLGLQAPAYSAPVSGAQPMAPVAPVSAVDPAEEERKRQLEALRLQQEAMTRSMAAQQPAPAAPAAVPQVAEAPAPAAAPAPQPQVQLPQPGPGVQLAGPVVPGALPQAQPAAAPALAPAPAAAPAGEPAPALRTMPITAAPAPAAVPAAAATTAAPAVMPMATPEGQLRSWTDDVAKISNNVTELGKYIANETNPEQGRQFAGKVIARIFKEKEMQDQAQQKAMAAVQSGDLLPLVRESKKNTEEASYIKAYLFQRLGLTELAKSEQQKLGAGSTYQGVMGANGERAIIQYSANGLPLKGFDAEGKQLSAEKLSEFATQAAPTKGATVGMTAFQVMEGPQKNELFWQRTLPNGTTQLVNDKGQVYSGSTANLRPFGVGSDIRTKNEIQLNELQNKLAYAPLNKRLEIIAESEAKYGPLDPRVKANILGTPTGVPQPGTVPGTVGQPSAAAAPAAPAAVAQPAPQAQGPVAPTAIRPAPTAAPQVAAGAPAITPGAMPQVAPVAPVAVPAVAGATPAARETAQKLTQAAGEAAIQQRKELAVAEQKPAAEARGKGEAKDINNQRYANETYGLIRPISDAIKQSTGSGLGTKVDQLAGVFGVGTTGAQAKAQLDVLGYNLVSNVPRFEGAQSDRDVALYERAAGDIANSEKPVAVRLAALQTIIQMLKKYDKEKANDWTFAAEQPAGAGGIKIIKREKVK